MTKHLRLIMLSLLAMICLGGYSQSEEKPLFYESFDKNESTGGNDGKFSGNIASLEASYYNAGWNGKNVTGANKCVKIGSTDHNGSIITPTIKVSTKCLLSFKAAAWDTKKEKLTIKVSVYDKSDKGKLTYNNKTAQSVIINMVKAKWTDYAMEISGASEFTITFEGLVAKNRFFLDEVKVTKVEEVTPAEITLDENSDNIVEAAENVNVTLKRTLYGDGGWNTLCVPFSLNTAQVKAAFGNDVELRKLAGVNGNTITFEPETKVEAGVPYLIKLSEANAKGTYTFTGVNTIAVTKADAIGTDQLKAAISFVGIYSSQDVAGWATEGEDYVACLGADNMFFKAKAGTKMKGFRAFFLIPENTPASAVKAVIDGTATGIEDLVIDGVKANGRVYNLNGQYVGNSLNGLQPGLYIQNGKKIVVK